MNLESAVVLFTAKSANQIIDDGGSQAWVLNPEKMGNVKYAICTRNSDRRHDEECGRRFEPHNSAFLAGKISGIRKVGRENDRDRYIIEFSEYATIDEPVLGFRHGSLRNPVTYSDVDQAQSKGLDLETLDWKPMPNATSDANDATMSGLANSQAEGLTIHEAKAGLAIKFGVPIDAITVTISQ